jgi:hypothetical protein
MPFIVFYQSRRRNYLVYDHTDSNDLLFYLAIRQKKYIDTIIY